MKLGVNVDHVATLRQARQGSRPDPVWAARVCQRVGADAVVMHLREDRRHIQDKDLFSAKEALRIKLNLEMSLSPEIIKIAAKLKPQQVTLVPEKRKEMTTESGLNLVSEKKRLLACVELFKKKGIEVSLFIDPDTRQVDMAKVLKADAVEFHTGTYAEQSSLQGAARELERLKKAVNLARQAGLKTHAGHGLGYQNVKLITKIQGIEELNIGYSIVVRALETGFESAVKEMLRLIKK